MGADCQPVLLPEVQGFRVLPGEAWLRHDAEERRSMSKGFKTRTRVISGREARRMGERERQREERMKDVDAFWALSPEERKRRMADNEAFQRISRNGITLDDLKMCEDQGRKDGYQLGTEESMKACYAAMCLVLHKRHGFDGTACMEMLRLADEKITYALNTAELLDELKNELDIEFCLRESMSEDRIGVGT